MIIDRNAPIGIFDSGVGGLTVARQVMREMPGESIVYFGDTNRAPYGVRTKENITDFSMQIMRFLSARNMKMVIIACNTICVTCYYELCGTFNVPIFEIVSPAAADCMLNAPRTGYRVGVIATPATVRSGGYKIELQKINPNITVIQKPCPDLVVLAERGMADSASAALTCGIYLESLKAEGIHSLILGCTHFPLFSAPISQYMGPDVRLVDPAVSSAAKVSAALREANLFAVNPAPPKHEFYISGDIQTFKAVARNLLGIDVAAEKIDIESY